METWKVKKLKDVCEIVNGTHSIRRNDNEKGVIPWVQPSDITKKTLQMTEHKISQELFDELSLRYLPCDSVIFVVKGDIGKKCISTQKVTLSHSLVGLICDNEVNNEYLYYYLDTVIPDLMSLATGVKILEISKSDLEDLEIIYPSLVEQRKIASRLSNIDKYIDLLQCQLYLKKKLRKGLMSTLFNRGLNHSEYKMSKLGEIPKLWKLDKIKEYIELVKGKNTSKLEHIQKEGMKPYYVLDEERTLYTDNKNCQSCSKQDIILYYEGGNAGKIERGLEGYISKSFVIIKVNESLNQDFVYYFLKEKERMLRMCTVGHVIKRIHKGLFNLIDIVIPPIEEQQKIASILLKNDEAIIKIEDKLKHAKRLKRGFIQKLIINKESI